MKRTKTSNLQLTNAMKVAKRDAQFFRDVYEAVMQGENILRTDYLHPNGMLPLPIGYACVTEKEVIKFGEKYEQKLKADMREIIKNYPHQIKMNIWLSVMDDSICADRKEFKRLQTSYQKAYEERQFDMAEEIAGEILYLFKE